METLIQNISNKTDEVSSILDKQIDAVTSATENNTQRHNQLLELFNQQSSILNNTASNTVQYVTDVIQTLDEKAETINLLFKNQQAEFVFVSDKLASETDNIANNLKKQINLLDQGSERVFNRMSGFENEFSHKADLLTTTSNQTMEKVSAITLMH